MNAHRRIAAGCGLSVGGAYFAGASAAPLAVILGWAVVLLGGNLVRATLLKVTADDNT